MKDRWVTYTAGIFLQSRLNPGFLLEKETQTTSSIPRITVQYLYCGLPLCQYCGVSNSFRCGIEWQSNGSIKLATISPWLKYPMEPFRVTFVKLFIVSNYKLKRCTISHFQVSDGIWCIYFTGTLSFFLCTAGCIERIGNYNQWNWYSWNANYISDYSKSRLVIPSIHWKTMHGNVMVPYGSLCNCSKFQPNGNCSYNM